MECLFYTKILKIQEENENEEQRIAILAQLLSRAGNTKNFMRNI